MSEGVASEFAGEPAGSRLRQLAGGGLSRGPSGQPVVLRVVGYPGKLRLDHPVSLQVLAGRREWQLDDITLANPVLASDGREAAAEFDLDPADRSQQQPAAPLGVARGVHRVASASLRRR